MYEGKFTSAANPDGVDVRVVLRRQGDTVVASTPTRRRAAPSEAALLRLAIPANADRSMELIGKAALGVADEAILARHAG